MHLYSILLLLGGIITPSLSSSVTPLQVTLNVSEVVNEVSPLYVSANLDWHTDAEEPPFWVNGSAMVIDLENQNLKALAAAFSPAHLRVGGSEGDCILYEITGGDCARLQTETQDFCLNNSIQFPNAFCLQMTRWEQILSFAQDSGMHIAFGLNAMLGRNGSAGPGPFDSSNAIAFMEYIYARNSSASFARTLTFEFGNELEFKVDADVYAKDLISLKAKIDSIWSSVAAADRPRLVANDENPDPSYWAKILPTIGTAIHAATWHSYVGYGLDPTLASKAFNYSFLYGTDSQALPMIEVSKDFVSNGGELWVGETAMAWHSGRENVTDTYLSGPWYINALGWLAKTHRVHCRQTLVGGNYGLIDHFSLLPNPDYFTALLWKRTMGTKVLQAVSNYPENVLVFAHCALQGNGAVAVAFINLDSSVSYSVTFSNSPMTPRDEYVLTPFGGDLAAKQVLLNDATVPLGVANGIVSPTPPKTVTDPSVPLVLSPNTYGFIVLSNANAAVCM
jgi:heparanase 1